MTNGRIDAAKIDALMHGPQEDRDRYLLTCAVETRHAIEDIPDIVATYIQDQRKRDLRVASVVAGAIAAIVSMLTPYLLRLF